jgi:hypothetical protein
MRTHRETEIGMTTTTRPPTGTSRSRSLRKTATVAGVLFLLTEVTAIGGTLLYGPLLSDPDYLLTPGPAAHAYAGAFAEVLLIVTAVGTAVTLYPVLKRQNEVLALAFVVARVLETAAIMVGILSLLSIVTLKENVRAGTDSSVRLALGDALLAAHDWAFLLGPGFALGVASLLLATLVFASRLVPRPLAILGLLGGALISLSSVAVLLGTYTSFSPVGLGAALPVFAWEVSFAIWLITKGLRGPLMALDDPRSDRPGTGTS